MKPRYKLIAGSLVLMNAEPMHPADIKAALQKKGLSQISIARQSKRGPDRHVDKSAVCRVIAGNLKSVAIAQTIARAVGMPVASIWPGKYPELAIADALAVSAKTATSQITAMRKNTARKGASV
jgi:lambda repressor-like predicted transcriptional regulator